MDTKAKGDRCESLVADYLEKLGYQILERNYGCRFGEIDILSFKDGVLCITEVKSQSTNWDDDQIQFQVNPMKRMRLRRTVEHYLMNEDCVHYSLVRFDVASVRDGQITYYEDAF